MRIVIKNGYLLTLDNQHRVFECGDLYIEGSIIKSIGRNLNMSEINPDRVIDAAGKLVAPGFVNADFHASDVLYRGLLENLPFEMRSITPRLCTLIKLFDPEFSQTIAYLSGMLAIRSGITCIQDHWTLAAKDVLKTVDSIIGAYSDLGLRTTLAIEFPTSNPFLEIPYISEILPPAIRVTEEESILEYSSEEITATYLEIIDRWHHAHDGLFQIAIVPSEAFWQDSRFIDWIRKICSTRDVGLHFHLYQSKSSLLGFNFKYPGETPMAFAEKAGLLIPGSSITYGTWAIEQDIDRFAKNHICLVYAPLSELYHGNGLSPITDYMNHEVVIGLGNGVGYGGNHSMFDLLKIAASIHRIAQPDHKKWPSNEQILAMATRNGALCCHTNNGMLVEGSVADIVLYDRNGYSLTPLNDPITQLVTLETGSSVDTVIINGRVVLEKGQFLSVDENQLLSKVESTFQKFNKILAVDTRYRLELEPYVKYAYQKCINGFTPIHQWGNHSVIPSQLHKL